MMTRHVDGSEGERENLTCTTGTAVKSVMLVVAMSYES